MHSIRSQPTPIKDYMNFKKMGSGSEVIMNLENFKNLENSELVGGMMNLTSRAKGSSIDWNEHPIVSRCIKDLKERQPRLSSKHVAQIQLIL